MSLETHQYIEKCPGDQEEVLDFFNDLFGFFELIMVVVRGMNLIKKVTTTVIEIIMTEYRVLCVMTRKLHSYVTSPVLRQENVIVNQNKGLKLLYY